MDTSLLSYAKRRHPRQGLRLYLVGPFRFLSIRRFYGACLESWRVTFFANAKRRYSSRNTGDAVTVLLCSVIAHAVGPACVACPGPGISTVHRHKPAYGAWRWTLERMTGAPVHAGGQTNGGWLLMPTDHAVLRHLCPGIATSDTAKAAFDGL